jgi:hypothetical protein
MFGVGEGVIVGVSVIVGVNDGVDEGVGVSVFVGTRDGVSVLLTEICVEGWLSAISAVTGALELHPKSMDTPASKMI